MTEQSPHNPNTNDPYYRILRDLPLGRESKADIWDSCVESTSSETLKLHLERFDLPEDIERALIAARRALEPSERDVVVGAIRQLSQIDPSILRIAEAHPNLLKNLVEAARRERGAKHSDHPDTREDDDR